MPEDPAAAAHAHALRALRAVAAGWSEDRAPGQLVAAIAAAAGEDELDPRGIGGLACQYLFGARVGAGVATDPERAVAWVRGWSAARARHSSEVAAALAAGVGFGQRVAALLEPS